MLITYQAESYTPALVTGRYVRRTFNATSYKFRVYETATCWQRGPHYGKAGMGYTLREWTTQGDEIPETIKVACKDGSMQKWELQQE